MSEDPTKEMQVKYDTKPTIEPVLERINALEQTLTARFEQALTERVDKLQEQISIRLDRIESEVKQTHSELYSLRADFTELGSALKEQFPVLR